MQKVEHEIGRRPAERWGPRPIDIDLLLYGDAVIDESERCVPHPEMPARGFVLVPVVDVAGDVLHPELGESISSLAAKAGRSGVRLVADVGWEKPIG